jgi:hypothetical protein
MLFKSPTAEEDTLSRQAEFHGEGRAVGISEEMSISGARSVAQMLISLRH